MGRNKGVGFRVPFSVIHTVEDADQVAGPFPDYSLKAPAELGGLDFPGIALAHGGELRGVVNPPLEEVDLVVLL